MSVHLPERLQRLAGAGLPHARPLDVQGWSPHLDEVIAHGLAGLLAHCFEEGNVDLERGDVDVLEERLADEATLAVRLEAELIRLAPVLDDAGAVVLKGPVLAHGAYPSPSWRPFTDLDVLVPARELDAVTAALLALGYERPRPDPTGAFQLRVAKATALAHPAGLLVDLHRTLASGNTGEGIDVETIVAGRQVDHIGAVPVPRPAWHAHLVEVCLHAAVGDGLARALSVRDVAQVAMHPDLDAARAVACARSWCVESPVAIALLAARDDLGASLPEPLERWVDSVDATAPRAGAAGRSATSRLDELRRGGARRRLSLLHALVAPRPSFLRWRYGEAPLATLYWRRWRDLSRRSIDPWRTESPAMTATTRTPRVETHRSSRSRTS